MRAMIAQVSSIGIGFKPAAAVLTLLFIFFMAALIVVRQQCIRQGYEISSLTVSMDKKNLEYELLSREYSLSLRREALMEKAAGMDFVFPVGGRVFYVQR